jgi:hypothetical protein
VTDGTVTRRQAAVKGRCCPVARADRRPLVTWHVRSVTTVRSNRWARRARDRGCGARPSPWPPAGRCPVMASRLAPSTAGPDPVPGGARRVARRLVGGLVVAGLAVGGLGLEAGALVLTSRQAPPSPAAATPGRHHPTWAAATPLTSRRGLLPSSGEATDRVDLRVVGGPGPEVFPRTVVVPLHRAGSALVGSLPSIMVLDAQGTLSGWTLVARLPGEATGPAVLVPAPPRAAGGRPDEVRAGAPGPLRRGRPAVVAVAPAGGGDGRFELGGELLLPAAGQQPLRALRLVLSVRAGGPPAPPRRPPSR